MRYPAVLSEALTIQSAFDGKNLARFGDGELKLATGRDAKSQRHHPALERALRTILKDWRNPRCLPCIPRIGARTSPKEAFWSAYRGERFARLYDIGGFYGSSFVTRPDSAPDPFTPVYWSRVQGLWLGKEVVTVTGSGKGLAERDMAGATGVEVVAAPRQHAWDEFPALLDRLKEERRPVFLCIGATATVLAWELAKHGVRAYDLGHLAIFMRKLRNGDPLEVTDADRAEP